MIVSNEMAYMASEWDTLDGGDPSVPPVFYRRTLEYNTSAWANNTLPAGGDLSDYILVAAPNGGPVALMRDDSKPVLVKAGTTGRSGTIQPILDVGPIDGRRKHIWVYTCSGTLIKTIHWEYHARVIKFGFTALESLVVVAKDGAYRVYAHTSCSSTVQDGITATSGLMAAYTQHSIDGDLNDAHVLDARVHLGGAVILTSALQFIEIQSWPERAEATRLAADLKAVTSQQSFQSRGAITASSWALDRLLHSAHDRRSSHRVARMAQSGLESVPDCWTIVTADRNTSKQVEVLMTIGTAIHSLDQLDLTVHHLSNGPYSAIRLSRSGKYLALLKRDPPLSLIISTNDYSEIIANIDLTSIPGLQIKEATAEIAWCGDDSVLVAESHRVTLLGPSGQHLSYYFDTACKIGEDSDGTRVFSSTGSEFLQKVAAPTIAVFQPGSAHPAAILFEAYGQYTAKSAHTHDLLGQIKVDLPGAVKACVDAAGREFSPSWQRKLLKAAAFGKSFIDVFDPSDFVKMSESLRILNAMRSPEIGVPLSYDQLLQNGLSNQLARLVLRGHHLLAMRICQRSGISAAPIVRHWAECKVTTSKDDEQSAATMCSMILQRLQIQIPTQRSSFHLKEQVHAVSCAEVAAAAWKDGKTTLATMLLAHETRLHHQVQLLLTMQEDNLALMKAMQSGDNDLVLSTLLRLHRQHPLAGFFRLLERKEESIAVLASYGKVNDPEIIRDYWFQEDRQIDAATFSLEAASNKFSWADASRTTSDVPTSDSGRTSTPKLLSADQFAQVMNLVRDAQKHFAQARDATFEAKACEDYAKLLAFQQSLAHEVGTTFHNPFVGKSLYETITQCYVHSLPKKAEKLRSDFKIPDKRWWHLRLRILIESRDWEGLNAFSRSKKSPIGYEPFVEKLLGSGNPRQALQYIARCEAQNRADLYIRAGDWVKAGEVFRDRGERARLQELVQACDNSITAAELASFLEDVKTF